MNSSTAASQGMLCPVCKVTLSISDRQGVEIDFCPQCRGVWLDRGELDKIIERSEAAMPSQSRDDTQQRFSRAGYYDDDRHLAGNHGKKRKSGLLSDLLEIGGSND